MELLVFVSVAIAIISVFICGFVIRRVKAQINGMLDALEDIKAGNGNRRILSATDEFTASIAYEVNDIVSSYEKELSSFRQAEEVNKQLMTSLSHDVRTPLTTLIGYLDAAHISISRTLLTINRLVALLIRFPPKKISFVVRHR